MSLSKTEEATLKSLFIRQEILSPTDPEYLQNRDVIARLFLKRFQPDLQKAERSWQRKYRLDADECQSLLQLSLLTAIDAFKISRGNCKFTSFFWTITSQMFKNYMSQIYAQKRMPRIIKNAEEDQFAPIHSLSLPHYYSGDDNSGEGEQFPLLEKLPQDEFRMEKKLHHSLVLKKIYDQATPKQKRVLKRLYTGRKYREVGQMLKMSPSDVCNVVKQIREQHQSLVNEL